MKLSKSEAGKLGGLKSKETGNIKYLLRIEHYNNNPKQCLGCGKSLDYNKRYNKFCNHSCSASITNIGVTRHGIKSIYHKCLNCDNMITSKYCSIKCQQQYQTKKMFEEIEKTGEVGGDNRVKAKKYLIYKFGHSCQICKTSEWLGKPILLIADHIDGDSRNNKIENYQIICSNCDATLDTYKAKNKGKGRINRKMESDLIR